MTKLIEKIKEYNKIYVLGHVKPDGDCYGASMGMAELIKTNFEGKEVTVVNEHSDFLNFLGECTLPGTVDYSGALVIQVDTANSARSCDQNFLNGDCIVKIDHHVVVDEYGDIQITRQISSCCEIIATIAIENNLVISKEAARPLYAGIATDTGRFFFPGVNADTLRIAAKLLDTGFDMSELLVSLSLKDIATFKYQAYIYEHIQESEKGVLYLYIDKETIKKLNLTNEQVSQAISSMSMVRDHPIWVLFYEMDDIIRVRLRSDRIKLNQVAENFRGGGHHFASGATLNDKSEVVDIIKQLNDLL